MSQKIEKQSVPVFLNEDNEPIAVIFTLHNRDKVIFLTKKADEEEIIGLYECKEVKLKAKADGE